MSAPTEAEILAALDFHPEIECRVTGCPQPAAWITWLTDDTDWEGPRAPLCETHRAGVQRHVDHCPGCLLADKTLHTEAIR